MKRKAKFRVRQIVVAVEDNEPVRIAQVRLYDDDGIKRFEYLCTGWRFYLDERDLRPLTRREIGLRKGGEGKRNA